MRDFENPRKFGFEGSPRKFSKVRGENEGIGKKISRMRLRVFQIFPLRIFENDPQKFSNFASRMRVALSRIFTTLIAYKQA